MFQNSSTDRCVNKLQIHNDCLHHLLYILFDLFSHFFSSWWTDLRLYEKLPFIRDRLAENYLWAVGFAFEPKEVNYRIAIAKQNCLITTIDDIYDVYGLLHELE